MDIQRIQAGQTVSPFSGTPIKQQPKPATPANNTPIQDQVKITTRGVAGNIPASRISFVEETPADETARREFASAVHLDADNHKELKRFLRFFSITPDQERQIQAAEAMAFSRFFNGLQNPDRASLAAKLQQSQIQHYAPGYLEHGSPINITDDERKEIQRSLQKFGEDLLSIGITGRDRKALQRFLEDKFFITIFDRDKEEFEDYFKGGFHNWVDDNFSSNDPVNNPVANGSGSGGLIDIPDPNAPREDYKWKFFRPSIGASLRGLDYEKIKLKPKVDLVRLQGPAHTEVRLTAEAEYQINGELAPQFEVRARRMFNYTPGDYGKLTDNLWAEGHTEYDLNEGQFRASVGLRKQLSPDSSAGLFALYGRTFVGEEKDDLGLGVNYQSRWN